MNMTFKNFFLIFSIMILNTLFIMINYIPLNYKEKHRKKTYELRMKKMELFLRKAITLHIFFSK
jgi:hypothetical protein